MSYLLDRPEAVLVVGEDTAGAALTDGVAADATVVEGPEQAAEALNDRSDVGCVLVDAAHQDPVAVAEVVRPNDVELPIVVVGADDETAAELTAIGDCRLLPADATAADVRAAVDDALVTYERRRRHRAESSMFTTLLEEAETPIYVKDREGRHLRLADVPEGPEPDEVFGETDLDVWGEESPAMAQRTFEDDRHVVESGEAIYEQDERFVDGNGDHWSRTTKVPWRENGDVVGLVGISQDITDHVERAEQLEEQRQRINQFTSYVSHDLQTPLQVASGALEMARETGDEESFEKVESALERMEETIDDLSQLVQRQAATEIDRDMASAVDLAAARGIGTPVLADVVENVWNVVGADEATLTVEVPPETTITADEESLRPLVENLLKNAVEHAGPDVAIRVGLTGDHGFYVEDDGPGIPAEDRDAVFEEGFTTSEDGTGMGLTIVAEVASEYDWDLAVTDGIDGGTRIEVNDCLLVTSPPPESDPDRPITFDRDMSIGAVRVSGSAEYVESIDRWIVEGSGTDVRGDVNEFHYAYGTATAPIRIQGRVADVDEVSDDSKAGFMIRDDTNESAAFGYLGVTPGHGTEVIWRSAEGEPAEGRYLEDPPGAYEWYRLEYRDGVVTCAVSSAGTTFRPIAQLHVDMSGTLTVGLAVCSSDHRRSCVAQFEGVAASQLER